MADVRHNKEQQRYEILVDDNVAGYAAYVDDSENKVRDFNHTVVEDDYRGQGLSKPLIQFALEDTQEFGYTVIPSCSAVAGFIKKNPQFQDNVKA